MSLEVWEGTHCNNDALLWFTKFVEGLNFGGLVKNGFVNFFYGDLEIPLDTVNNRQLIAVFKNDTLNLQWVRTELEKKVNISTIYFKNKGEYCCIVFNIPEGWHSYYDLVIQGKFSQIPHDFLDTYLNKSDYNYVKSIAKKEKQGLLAAREKYKLDIPEEAEEYWSKPSKRNFIWTY